jgi:hypothetical protein
MVMEIDACRIAHVQPVFVLQIQLPVRRHCLTRTLIRYSNPRGSVNLATHQTVIPSGNPDETLDVLHVSLLIPGVFTIDMSDLG